MTEKQFTTVELPKPNKWGIWYDGAYLSTYQVCILLNEYVDVKKENEQLKKHIQELQKHCKRLENENIQTYTLIKEAYNNERTQLGKSVLKQLLNNIEAIQ